MKITFEKLEATDEIWDDTGWIYNIEIRSTIYYSHKIYIRQKFERYLGFWVPHSEDYSLDQQEWTGLKKVVAKVKAMDR